VVSLIGEFGRRLVQPWISVKVHVCGFITEFLCFHPNVFCSVRPSLRCQGKRDRATISVTNAAEFNEEVSINLYTLSFEKLDLFQMTIPWKFVYNQLQCKPNCMRRATSLENISSSFYFVLAALLCSLAH